MKKILVIMLALFLAVPAITYAGSATSRWDLVIGGYLEFETGYNTQAVGSALSSALPGGFQGNQNAANEMGNYFMSMGQSELNFLVKGPDAWGAKTMAFLSGDFIGQWSATNNGSFEMKFAFIKLDWGNTNLTIGQVPSTISTLPTWSGNALNFSTVTPFNKGTPNTQQVMLQQKFGKNWFVNFGIMNSGLMNGTAVGGTSGNNSYNNSGMPAVAGDINYTTDSCGKIGPWQMLFSLGGMLGSQKNQYNSQVSAAIEGDRTVARKYGDTNLNTWLVEAKTIIPIIPQKKEDKKGALMTAFSAFTSQNVAAAHLNMAPNSYSFGTATNPTFSAPVVSGGYAHIMYYLTNQVYVNALLDRQS
ncbi:MAG: hypothetical protein NT178_06780 [Proteobacteria bacterium]|nr:hypothetical protein [Pseudomonadota bacterium]